MSNWGKAHENNTIGFGQGSANNSIGWGNIYDKSNSGKTILNPVLSLFKQATVAYSLRDLELGVPHVVRVRRSSDSLEQDFTETQIIDGSLTAFCGSGDGFVPIWYDQKGLHDASQSTASAQPKIVNAGNLILENGKPSIRFLNSKLKTSIFNLIPQPTTRIVVGKANNSTNLTIIDGTEENRGLVGAQDGFNRLFAGNVLDKGAFLNTQQIFYALFNGESSEIVINGISKGTGNSGDAGLEKVIFGAHSILTNRNLDGTMQEVIIYPSDKSAERTEIETNINNHYAIY